MACVHTDRGLVRRIISLRDANRRERHGYRAVYPPPKPEQIRELRARTGLSQSQFALMFGFNIDTLQQYEQGRRVPSGPASTLLRVIAMEPDAVLRALDPRRARKRPAAAE